MLPPTLSRLLCSAATALLLGCAGAEPAGPGGGGGGGDDPPGGLVRWSDPAIWPGGALPVAGADVSIPAGQNVLLDISPPPLGRITINGELVFSDDLDLSLSALSIAVHGKLFIGSAARPHSRRAVLTLIGDGNGDVMGMGDKALGVMAGGVLEIHGQPRTRWLRLTQTAEAGATELTVARPVNWRVGDRIVIAATDFDYLQAEEATVASVSGSRIGLAAPLRYRHWGTLQTVAGAQVDERAEVGLLSRNVTIQGDSASLASGIGGHVMAMAGGQARIENAEFTRMGQKARLARYPMHWHLVNAAPGQYFRDNSIWKSFNRCVTIHGTDEAIVEGNVCHDHLGHGYFLEDGAESNNQLLENLGLTTRAPVSGEAVLPSDTRPATFWLTNPANVVQGNAAAGSRGFGFWYALPDAPTGLSTGAPDRPRQTPLGEFRDNVAHSNRNAGLNVDDGPRPDGTTETTFYAPRENPGGDSPAVIAVFNAFRAWKHSGRAVWLRGRDARLMGAVLSSNGIGATFASSETFVQSSVFVGETANNASAPFNGMYRGYEFYDGRVGAEDVTFANYTAAGTIPSSALGYLRSNAFGISTANYARGLRFINAAEVFLENPQADRDGDKAAVFFDETGSVSGTPGQYVVANVPFMLGPDCSIRSSWNAWVCTARRVGVSVRNNGAEAVAPLTVRRDDGEALALVGIPNNPQSANFTSIVNRGFSVEWGAGIPPRPRFQLNRSAPGDFVRITVPWNNPNVRIIRDYNSSRPLTPGVSVAEVDASSGDRWYFDAGAGQLHLKLVTQAGRDWGTLFVEPL